jgi:hypothetical protein
VFSEQAEESAATVVIQLLDPSQGGVLKTWKFQNKSSVSIGRAPECDVEVVDAYVSRTHAMLEFRDGQGRRCAICPPRLADKAAVYLAAVVTAAAAGGAIAGQRIVRPSRAVVSAARPSGAKATLVSSRV